MAKEYTLEDFKKAILKAIEEQRKGEQSAAPLPPAPAGPSEGAR
jgi:hypothetical protein